MATDTMSMPSTGTASMAETQDNAPEFIQVAEATGTQANPAPGGQAPGQQNVIPGVPNGEVHVTVPADQTVVRVQVAPGETIDLPFDGAMAAKFGEQGNLAVKVGDQTIILLGYAEANQQSGVTVHDSHGQPIDVASVVAQTDPNLDIQTAAGPAGGPAGGQGGHLFFGFNSGSGLGGFGELGIINPTELQYKLIQPDETITRFHALAADTHTLTIDKEDGGVTITITNTTEGRTADSNNAVGDHILDPANNGKALGAGMVTGTDTAFLAGGTGTEVTVTLEPQVSANKNLVGVYEYNTTTGDIIPGSVKFIWLDTESTDLLGNAQQTSVDLGTVAAGDALGFFIVDLDRINGSTSTDDAQVIKNATGGGGHGYDADLATLNSQVSIDPVTHQILINGAALKSQVYYSTDHDGWNPDKGEHTTSGTSDTIPGDLIIGFEDRNFNSKATPSDHDFDDVVFAVHVTDTKSSEVKTFVQPHITLTDTANDITQMTIETSGFLTGDTLVSTAAAAGFTVIITPLSGDNVQVTITETTGHTTAEWQDFVNGFHFNTTSGVDGERDISYTVTDSAGHSGSNTAAVDVVTQHADSLSSETVANHPADHLLHLGAIAGVDVTWGKGNDTLTLDQHFTSTDGHLDMGKGDNTLAVGVNGMNITSSDTSHVSNVDHIDTTGFGANNVTLNAADVIGALGADHNTLKFDGDGGTDSVTLNGDGAGAGGWKSVGSVNVGGHTYDEYQWHADGNAANPAGATVLINHDLNVTSHVVVNDQIV